ncbi:MAG: class I SAM-dependent methyltransferase, partial [Brachymonas sp.]|nr:class I SAM-dependent methyltransferase [Brachymonas sp.]
MKFTGERFVPTEQGEIRIEHYHRYAVVLDIVKGKAVLDVACGEGYGSFLMADVARTVVGVDISEDAVQHASSIYHKPNLEFFQGSATNLAFANASFDVVVSFETIEHLLEQEEMLSEIRRVLRPDGILVISSPNRPVYSEESGRHNEFHLKELDFQEFDTLLHVHFSKVRYLGQRLQMSSVIQPLSGTSDVSSVWVDDGSGIRAHSGRLKDPVYFLALCGSANANIPHIGMSALYPESTDLVKHYVGFAKWAQTLDGVVVERNEQISNLMRTVAERDGQIIESREQLGGLMRSVAEHDGQIAEYRD